ncbi:hypothetical protein LOK49_LG06G01259 [Camellia lanceoleosa]|uniref:Uncharacterized protein n=1 Tax=Camellia lanceoleosa TaxID=1840588 RepID=A0ACC0HGE1_9ERIC|nr:hypothetical protein LOK49_LG06G01259 [Camellia lanceoleosa]
MKEEGKNLPTLKHTLIQDRVMVVFTLGKELFHLIASEGWNEEVKVRIQPWRQVEACQNLHYVMIKSMEDNHKAVRGYLALEDQSPIPNHTIPSMDMLIWNCRGVGNQRFKRTMRELVQIHKPELLILIETKVEFKSVGMFINCMGFTASAHMDPIGRSGGIWMIWNPNVVNVRVVEASS